MAGVTLASAERAVKQVIASGQIGGWKLNEELGGGGFGVTWLATKKELNGSTVKAVIKLTQPELLVGETMDEVQAGQQNFHKEFVILQALSSPHIARLLDGGIQETKSGVNVPWLALERVQGTPLHEEIQHEPLDENHWLRVARDLCEALRVVHDAGLVHLDVKPANIVLRARGAVLIDFGIASLRDMAPREGIGGTLGFFAPEQLDGSVDASDAAAAVDMFKAGVTLVIAAQRTLPWAVMRETAAAARERLKQAPDMSGLTPLQRQVVGPMLSFDPNQRPSAVDARDAIDRILAGTAKHEPAPAPAGGSVDATAPSPSPVDQPVEVSPRPAPPAVSVPTPSPSSPSVGEPIRDAEALLRRRRNADLIASIVLLGVGFFGMFLGVVFGLVSAFNPAFGAAALGFVMAVSHLALYAGALVFTVIRLKRRKVAFWIPLAAGAVASVTFLTLAAIIGGTLQ